MYIPKLRYAFCIMRLRSIWNEVSLIKYLNSVGIEPYVTILSNHPAAKEILKGLEGAKFKSVNVLPTDYDVLLTEGSGHNPFETETLLLSRKRGKINLSIQNTMSTRKYFPIVSYMPERTKNTIDGMCIKNQRTIDHHKTFTKNLFLLNTGSPDWDWFETDDFKNKVEDTKKRYGNKILLLGTSWLLKDFETPYYDRIIKWAEKEDYKVIIKVHVDNKPYERRNKDFDKYTDNTTHRHVLFAASSHATEYIGSTMISECLFFGKRVGTSPAFYHFKSYTDSPIWMDNPSRWYDSVLPKVGKEIMDLVPLIVTEDDVHKFLSSSKTYASQERIDKIFGWPRISNYCEYLFKCVDDKINEKG